MRKLTLIIAFISLGVATCYAQRQEDVIYLKNGGITRGKLVELDSTKVDVSNTIGIRTRMGNVFVYDKTEVERTGVENKYRKERYFKEKGYYAVVQTGLLWGRNRYGIDDPRSFLRVTQGYQSSKRWSTGVGIEISAPHFQTIMPVHLETRYAFNESPRSTYISANAGYIIPLDHNVGRNWRDKEIGGMKFGASIGRRLFISDGTALDFSLGYRFQKLTTILQRDNFWPFEDNFISGKNIARMHRVEMNIGFYFN